MPTMCGERREFCRYNRVVATPYAPNWAPPVRAGRDPRHPGCDAHASERSAVIRDIVAPDPGDLQICPDDTHVNVHEQ